jgi:hypothetical protein
LHFLHLDTFEIRNCAQTEMGNHTQLNSNVRYSIFLYEIKAIVLIKRSLALGKHPVGVLGCHRT